MPDRHPLYAELTKTADADGEAGDVQWNFEKFLLAPGGKVAKRFRPRTVPDAPEVIGGHRRGLAAIAEKTAAIRVLETVATPDVATIEYVAGQLIVSISGICDRTLPEVEGFCAQLDERDVPVSFLVAPRIKGGYRLDRRRAYRRMAGRPPRSR